MGSHIAKIWGTNNKTAVFSIPPPICVQSHHTYEQEFIHLHAHMLCTYQRHVATIMQYDAHFNTIHLSRRMPGRVTVWQLLLLLPCLPHVLPRPTTPMSRSLSTWTPTSCAPPQSLTLTLTSTTSWWWRSATSMTRTTTTTLHTSTSSRALTRISMWQVREGREQPAA